MKSLKKKSLDELRREASRLQKNSLISRAKRAIRNIPEASTRFQLELDIAARKAARKEAKKLKKKGRKAIISYLRNFKL